MKNIEVISLDMFQTLVNVNSRIEHIWRPILQDEFTTKISEEYAQLLIERFLFHWKELRDAEKFYLINEIYERGFADIFNDKAITFNPSEAVGILFNEHTLAHFYDDTTDFLENISQKYKVCIVSDSDNAMIPNFHKKYGFKLFISEQYQSYKNDDKNLMFKELLKYYDIDSKQILHIGDSSSDVIGAHREGIVSCWLNRDNKTWEHEIKPDYIIESLDEVDKILLAHQGSASLVNKISGIGTEGDGKMII